MTATLEQQAANVAAIPGTKRIEIRNAPLVGRGRYRLLRILHECDPVCAADDLSRGEAREIGARLASMSNCPLVDRTVEAPAPWRKRQV